MTSQLGIPPPRCINTQTDGKVKNIMPPAAYTMGDRGINMMSSAWALFADQNQQALDYRSACSQSNFCVNKDFKNSLLNKPISNKNNWYVWKILSLMNTHHGSGSQETFYQYQSSSSAAWSQLVVSALHRPQTNCVTTNTSHLSYIHTYIQTLVAKLKGSAVYYKSHTDGNVRLK